MVRPRRMPPCPRPHAPHAGAGRHRAAREAVLLITALTMLAACALPGCAAHDADEGKAASATTSFVAMDTAMAVTAYAPDQDAANEAVSACAGIARGLDEALSPIGEGSWIARANAADGEPVPASDDELRLVEAALGVAEETAGTFDPTVFPLTSAWGFTSGDYRTPSDAEIEAVRALVGFDAVRVDAASGSVSLDNGAQIDVGGIAKGYAADLIAAELRKRGASGALVDLGGNVTVLGSKPDGAPWTVGIADPASPDQLAGTLQLADQTVSTSGDYQRFFIDDEGVRRHHLIDPATGYPAESGLASVSVVSPSGARCDALSTALFVMGADRAVEFWRAAQGGESAFEAVLVTEDGDVLVTEGLADAFLPAGQYADRVEAVRR